MSRPEDQDSRDQDPRDELGEVPDDAPEFAPPEPEELAAAIASAEEDGEPIAIGSGIADRVPIVAIVGRPNVGKSTLFNRLIGSRRAIVHDLPGITRDRISERAELLDDFTIELVDTGGLVPGDDPLGLGDQVMLAVEESDLLLLVVDGREGLTAADERVVQAMRRADRRIVLVVNKGDTKVAQEQYADFYRLGTDDLVLVSAEHGLGVPALVDILVERLGEPDAAGGATGDPAAEIPSLAIVGRPNVGKSSLVNRLLGTSRVLVSPVAGTTRDPIDTLLEHEGTTYRLIDTAGIRRRSQVSGAAEEIAVMFARRQMERAHVVVLVVDASAGVTTTDMAIAGEAWELGRPVIVANNKWDLLDEEARDALELSWERLDELLANPARINISALGGRRVDRLMPAVISAYERSRIELGTSEVNRLFTRFVERHSAPQYRGRPWRLYYATQVATGPPTFMLFANRTLERSHTYRRYLENRLRDELDLRGIPVRLVIRRRT